MPFIEARDERRSEDGNACPGKRPGRASRLSHATSPSTEQQNAKEAVPKDVSRLANVMVPNFECRMVQAEEEVQGRIQNPAGVAGREIRSRFDRDDDQPKNGRDPCLEHFVLIGLQAFCDLAAGCAGLDSKCSGTSGARRNSRDFRESSVLLDRIVRCLASDHDVVDVRFA